jgi:hypothetical protein
VPAGSNAERIRANSEPEHRVLVTPVGDRRGHDVHVHVPVGDVPEGNDLGARVHVGYHGRRSGCEPDPLRDQ